MNQLRRIIRLGDRPVHERTDPDYVDKHLARLAKDIQDCPEEWLETFICGLPRWDITRLIEMGVLVKEKPNSGNDTRAGQASRRKSKNLPADRD